MNYNHLTLPRKSLNTLSNVLNKNNNSIDNKINHEIVNSKDLIDTKNCITKHINDNDEKQFQFQINEHENINLHLEKEKPSQNFHEIKSLPDTYSTCKDNLNPKISTARQEEKKQDNILEQITNKLNLNSEFSKEIDAIKLTFNSKAKKVPLNHDKNKNNKITESIKRRNQIYMENIEMVSKWTSLIFNASIKQYSNFLEENIRNENPLVLNNGNLDVVKDDKFINSSRKSIKEIPEIEKNYNEEENLLNETDLGGKEIQKIFVDMNSNVNFINSSVENLFPISLNEINDNFNTNNYHNVLLKNEEKLNSKFNETELLNPEQNLEEIKKIQDEVISISKLKEFMKLHIDGMFQTACSDFFHSKKINFFNKLEIYFKRISELNLKFSLYQMNELANHKISEENLINEEKFKSLLIEQNELKNSVNKIIENVFTLVSERFKDSQTKLNILKEELECKYQQEKLEIEVENENKSKFSVKFLVEEIFTHCVNQFKQIPNERNQKVEISPDQKDSSEQLSYYRSLEKIENQQNINSQTEFKEVKENSNEGEKNSIVREEGEIIIQNEEKKDTEIYIEPINVHENDYLDNNADSNTKLIVITIYDSLVSNSLRKYECEYKYNIEKYCKIKIDQLIQETFYSAVERFQQQEIKNRLSTNNLEFLNENELKPEMNSIEKNEFDGNVVFEENKLNIEDQVSEPNKNLISSQRNKDHNRTNTQIEQLGSKINSDQIGEKSEIKLISENGLVSGKGLIDNERDTHQSQTEIYVKDNEKKQIDENLKSFKSEEMINQKEAEQEKNTTNENGNFNRKVENNIVDGEKENNIKPQNHGENNENGVSNQTSNEEKKSLENNSTLKAQMRVNLNEMGDNDLIVENSNKTIIKNSGHIEDNYKVNIKDGEITNKEINKVDFQSQEDVFKNIISNIEEENLISPKDKDENIKNSEYIEYKDQIENENFIIKSQDNKIIIDEKIEENMYLSLKELKNKECSEEISNSKNISLIKEEFNSTHRNIKDILNNSNNIQENKAFGITCDLNKDNKSDLQLMNYIDEPTEQQCSINNLKEDLNKTIELSQIYNRKNLCTSYSIMEEKEIIRDENLKLKEYEKDDKILDQIVINYNPDNLSKESNNKYFLIQNKEENLENIIQDKVDIIHKSENINTNNSLDRGNLNDKVKIKSSNQQESNSCNGTPKIEENGRIINEETSVINTFPVESLKKTSSKNLLVESSKKEQKNLNYIKINSNYKKGTEIDKKHLNNIEDNVKKCSINYTYVKVDSSRNNDLKFKRLLNNLNDINKSFKSDHFKQEPNSFRINANRIIMKKFINLRDSFKTDEIQEKRGSFVVGSYENINSYKENNECNITNVLSEDVSKKLNEEKEVLRNDENNQQNNKNREILSKNYDDSYENSSSSRNQSKIIRKKNSSKLQINGIQKKDSVSNKQLEYKDLDNLNVFSSKLVETKNEENGMNSVKVLVHERKINEIVKGVGNDNKSSKGSKSNEKIEMNLLDYHHLLNNNNIEDSSNLHSKIFYDDSIKNKISKKETLKSKELSFSETENYKEHFSSIASEYNDFKKEEKKNDSDRTTMHHKKQEISMKREKENDKYENQVIYNENNNKIIKGDTINRGNHVKIEKILINDEVLINDEIQEKDKMINGMPNQEINERLDDKLEGNGKMTINFR
jgi:hypothetical protein